jgi:hypothetical protein
MFCQFIVSDEDERFARSLCDFLSNISIYTKSIWAKDFDVYKANKFPDIELYVKENANAEAMLKMLSKADLTMKFSLAQNSADFHYSEAKKYYQKIFDVGEDDRFKITITHGNDVFTY